MILDGDVKGHGTHTSRTQAVTKYSDPLYRYAKQSMTEEDWRLLDKELNPVLLETFGYTYQWDT